MESKKFSINEYVPAKKAARKDENCEYFCHNFVFDFLFSKQTQEVQLRYSYTTSEFNSHNIGKNTMNFDKTML